MPNKNEPTPQDFMFASGAFLTEEFPENFQGLTESQIDDFIRDKEWTPFEGWEPREVYELISDLAHNLANYKTK